MHRDLGEGAIKLAEIIGRQLNGRRSDVLVQAMELGGTWDRNDPGLLSQQPGERELSTCHPFPGRDLAEKIDQGLA